MFRGCKQEDLPPHIYSAAQIAYRDLLNTRRDQSLVFMGRSGSGKTSSASHCLHYLLLAAGSVNNIFTGKQTGEFLTHLKNHASSPCMEWSVVICWLTVEFSWLLVKQQVSETAWWWLLLSFIRVLLFWWLWLYFKVTAMSQMANRNFFSCSGQVETQLLMICAVDRLKVHSVTTRLFMVVTFLDKNIHNILFMNQSV